jgi:RNA-splicing ligase RtcB
MRADARTSTIRRLTPFCTRSRRIGPAACECRREFTEDERHPVAEAFVHEMLAEEAPLAYKDVSRVVDVVASANIVHKVARLRPLGVVKG